MNMFRPNAQPSRQRGALSRTGVAGRLRNWLHRVVGRRQLSGDPDARPSDFSNTHFFYPEPDTVLFHYTGIEAAIGMVQSREFWLSEFSKMNDRSEYTYARDNYVKAYQNRRVFVADALRFMTTFRLVGLEQNTVMMIGACTEQKDDAALWERYADQARGCVIGLDADWLAERAGVRLYRVMYGEEYITTFANAGLEVLQSFYEEAGGNLDQMAMDPAFFVLELFCLKDPTFRSEQEIRISRLTCIDEEAEHELRDPGGHNSDEESLPPLTVHCRDGRFGPTRFVKLPLHEGEKCAIRSIGFGPMCSSEDEARVREAAKHFSDIEFWHSSSPLRTELS